MVGVDERKGGWQNTLTTALSSWNAMAGMGMVTMPWAYSQAGLVLGIILTCVAWLLSYSTCYLIVLTAGKDIDYTLTMKKAMGKSGYTFGMTAFIINLMVPVLIFFQLQAQALFPVLLFCIGQGNREMDPDTKYEPSWDRFSYSYTCVIILLLTFLVTLKKDLSLYIKLNTIGVAGIIILGLFILITGFMGIT